MSFSAGEFEQNTGEHLTVWYKLTLQNKFSLWCIFCVQLHKLYGSPVVYSN